MAIVIATMSAFGASDGIKRIAADYGLANNPLAEYSRAVLIGLLLVLSLPSLRKLPRVNWSVLAYCSFATLSTFWSITKGQSLQAGITLVVVTGAYALCVSSMGIESVLRLVRNTLAISCGFGLGAYILGAGWAGVPGTYDLNVIGRLPLGGLFGWNVVAGAAAAFGLLLELSSIKERPLALNLAICLIYVIFVLLSASGTGLLLFIGAVPILFAVVFARRTHSGFAALALIVPLLAASYLALNPGATGAVEARLSGRDHLWEFGKTLAEQRPMLGWGYQSLLGGGYLHGNAQGMWLPVHFHNDLLQVYVELGLFGLVLFVSMLYFCLRRSLETSSRSESIIVAALPGLLIMSVINSIFNLSFGFFGPGWFFLLICAAHIAPKSTIRDRNVR